jgi:acetyl-CoA carboxylase biotin carboxylase subunit
MKRVLIINRGEIAIRIAKAVRELGHTAVGFWTDNELEPPHLEYCHEWLHLTGNNNTETYLNQDKILKLIVDNKIDAVHPGYGFLSENGEFCKKLEDHNVIFIGPHSQAIAEMGDKAVSKQIAKKANVPVIPGSTGEVPTVAEALKIATEIEYPVLLKAVAGGGGKGMRACFNEAELTKNFDVVVREAQSSFGNPGLLVEKLILNPHHIEVQILADKKGNTYHLFERECSVQRRHQKVIEEAPSPFIGNDEKVRADICETAVKLAKAVKYDSAGTVEFIMGEDKNFYFLEMNTRIQVEHPITEEVTGVDLLVNMIKAALGEDLDISSQADIKLRGHSIECRICAEDPVTMLPAPGRITGYDFTFPQGIRFDYAFYEGHEITPDFDPMIGKLISRGINREVALRKISNAIDNLKIEGLKTNIELHRNILAEKDFVQGHYSTSYLAEHKFEDKINAEDPKRLISKVLSFEASQL